MKPREGGISRIGRGGFYLSKYDAVTGGAVVFCKQCEFAQLLNHQ